MKTLNFVIDAFIIFSVLITLRVLVDALIDKGLFQGLFRYWLDLTNYKLKHSQVLLLKRLELRTGIRIQACKVATYNYAIGRLAYSSFRGLYSTPELNQSLNIEHIFINTPPNENIWYCTLFHELAHATGHKTRLNRCAISHDLYSKIDNYKCFEECIAELTAKMLMKHFGLLNDSERKMCDKYITRYALRGDIDLDYVYTHAKIAKDLILENWLIDFDKAS